MNPRVLDAIGFISRIVQDHWDQIVDPTEIHEELQNQGFSTEEISDAFSWIEKNTLGLMGGELDEREGATLDIDMAIKPPFRMLNALEQAKISPQGHGMLLSYYDRGLFDAVILEEIIERSMQSESEEVGVEDIRRITALTLFNRARADWQEFLPGTHMLVH